MTMIVRIWHGRVSREKADAYLDLTRDVGLPDYRSTPGNRAAYALRRDAEDGTVHVLTVTHWDSLEAVRAFAGPEPEKAKYYDFDPSYLLELEPTAMNFEVFASETDGA
jgi:heme-degrading monooxygenase HmoA